jgi:hypothetical protein
MLTACFKKPTATLNKRTDKYNKQTEKFEQAYPQGQAHLQFAQTPPANQKLQKTLPFFPPTRIHFSNLKGFKTPTLKKLKPRRTIYLD